MATDENVQSESRTPTIREELEGLVRSLFSTTEENSAPKRAEEVSARKMIPPPPMLDAERPSPKTDERLSSKTDGRADVAEQVGVMLRDLFESKDTFVISNAGVQAIIDGLLRRYRASQSPVLREKLLVHWRQDVPRLRTALMEAAKDDPLVLDTGQEVSLVTTQKAQALLERFCPETPYLPDTRGTRDVR
jgi:hypothetical protein